MPTADYAVMPETGTDGSNERNAELVLAPLADTRMVMSRRPLIKLVTLVFLACLAAGLGLRTLAVPGWPETAAACTALLALALWPCPPSCAARAARNRNGSRPPSPANGHWKDASPKKPAWPPGGSWKR